MTSVKIGVIADIQYCDCDNFIKKTKERFYRDSLNHLDNAIGHFLTNGCDKVLQLGDLMDAKCHSLQISDKVLKLMSEKFETDEFETFHVVGNHELYIVPRENYNNSFLGTSVRKYNEQNITRNYYKVDLSPEVRLIVLDCYDVSILGYPEHSLKDASYLKAEEILKTNNHNERFNDNTGLKEKKYASFNGAIGPVQIQWITEQLDDASIHNQIVILAGHVPILISPANDYCIIWNNEEIMQIIDQYPCVKAYFCGHDHDGLVLKTEKFLHVTMPGVVESRAEQRAYGILEISKNGLRLSELTGYWNAIQFDFN